jgi:hypothetical protein
MPKKWSSIILLPLHRTTAPPTVCQSVLHGDVPSHPSHLNQSQGFGRLTGGAKGVLSGVSLDIEAVGFRDNMTGVVDARHLNRMMDGKKEQSLSFLLSFDEVVLPTYVKLGYVRYAVRPHVQKPLQCYNCKKLTCGKCLSKE